MKIGFLCNSSFEIGSGHVRRCLTLAQHLSQRDHEIVFFGINYDGNCYNLITDLGFKSMTFLANDCNYLQVLSEIKVQDRELLVIDSYDLDHNFEKQIYPFLKKLVVIDDLANRNHHCDILIDQTFGRKESDYVDLVNHGCKLLTGSKYILLREEFLKLREKAILKRPKVQNLSRILITFGGSDNNHLTKKVLSVLDGKEFSEITFDVVVTDVFLDKDYLLEKYALSTNIQVHVNPSYMSELMLEADFAIGAGGTTTWERCSLGLSSLYISAAENQKVVINNVARFTGCPTLDKDDQEFTLKLRQILGDITLDKLKSLSEKCFQVCDGCGIANISDHLLISQNLAYG